MKATSDSTPLYRYLPANAALKTIEVRAFRVGQSGDFNDPFEWRMGMKGVDSDIARQVIDGFASLVHSDKKGILCFSAIVSDPVLWSLYAEKHNGVAFEVKHSWPAGHLHKMLYKKTRPILDAKRIQSFHDGKTLDAYLLSVLRHLMIRKSKSWSFEREYRVFIDLNNQEYCRLFEGRYYWRIPDNFLKRVILGFRCPIEVTEVRRLLDRNGLEATEVVRAEMCVETYSIRC